MAELTPLAILYRDDYIVAAFKPPGMLVHRSALSSEQGAVMLQQLRDQLSQKLYPVHRLDRATAGIVLFALSSQVAAALSGLFSERQIDKRYLACVRGWVAGNGLIDFSVASNESFQSPALWSNANLGDGDVNTALTHFSELPWQTIDYPLDKPKSHLTVGEQRQRQAQTAKGEVLDAERKTAQTRYRPIGYLQVDHPVDRYPQARYSLVELKPITGRPHQLRRHMKAIGHPIVGDVKYGKGVHNRFFRERLQMGSLLLLASKISFKHPITGQLVDIGSRAHCDFSRWLAPHFPGYLSC